MSKICIVVGMPRAATTYLYQTLASHPDAFVPARKELEFYSINYARGNAWYESFFADCRSDQVGFDISPIYFFSDAAIERIAELETNQRVILIARKPSEFALSWYKNRLVGDPNCPPLEQFLEQHVYAKDGAELELRIGPGEIPRRIRQYVDALGDRLLLLNYEDISQHALETMSCVEKFAGLSAYFDQENLSTELVNASTQQPNRVLAYLTHQKWFADLVTRVLPKNLILSARKRVQSTSKHKAVLPEGVEQEYAARIDALYAADDQLVADLLSAQLPAGRSE